MNIVNKINDTWACRILFFIIAFYVGLWTIRIPNIKDQLSIDYLGIGYLFFAFALGSIVTMIFASKIIKIFTPKIITLFVALLLNVLWLLIPFTTNFEIMLIFSALFGCCYGIFEVIINLQASIIEKRYQKSMMSSFHGFFSLGVLTGAFITSIFVEYQIHFFINVICYVIILAPIILICALTLVEEKEQDKKKEQSIFFLWPLLLFILVLLSITDALTEGGIDSWGSLYMRDFIKVEGFQIGLATISFNIFMVIGRFTGDRVKDILGVYSFLILLVSLSLIGITILLNFNTLILAIIGFAIVGYGSSSIVPICYSLSASIKGVDSTVGITIISIAIYGVFMIAPTIMGYIANNFGINYVFSPIVVMFTLSMVIILIFKKEFKFK